MVLELSLESYRLGEKILRNLNLKLFAFSRAQKKWRLLPRIIFKSRNLSLFIFLLVVYHLFEANEAVIEVKHHLKPRIISIVWLEVSWLILGIAGVNGPTV